MQNALWSPDGPTILAGRWGPPVLLDASATAPVSAPPAPPGLQSTNGIFFNSWLGAKVICDLRLGPTAPEIAVYTPAQAALEHTGVSGRSSVWLKGAAGPDPYRYFLFTRKGICFLYDRKLKSEIPLFSVFPNPMLDIDMPPDGRYIYVTQTIHDADLWLAHLGR